MTQPVSSLRITTDQPAGVTDPCPVLLGIPLLMLCSLI